MKQTYTEEDLIRFIYQEVDVFEYFEMDHAISNDIQLKEEFQELKEAKEMLPKQSHTPSDNAINNLLAYSKLPLALTA